MKRCPNCEHQMARVEMSIVIPSSDGGMTVGASNSILRCPECKHEEPYYDEDQTDADAGAEGEPGQRQGAPPETD